MQDFIYHFALYLLHIFLNKKNTINSIKLIYNPPKINRFIINNDFEESEESKEEKKSSNDKKGINSKNEDKIFIIKNKDLNNSENKFEKEKNNKNNNSDNNISKDGSLSKNNNINKISIKKSIKNNVEENIQNIKQNTLIIENNKNNNYSPPPQYEFKETNNNEILNINKFYINKRSIKNSKNLAPIQNINTNKELLDKETLEPKIIEPNIKIEKEQKSFKEYYWEYLSLEQPIINFLEFIKCLKVEKSYIPITIKLMKFIFILSLNMFFNIFHLEQKYFRNKYKYFNDKYNIKFEFLDKNISLNEKFKYAFGHSIISGIISFVVCLIIQLILNYFVFNIRKKINKINNSKLEKIPIKNKSISNNNNERVKNDNINKDIILLFKDENKKYLIFFGVGFIIMILIFYSLVNFNQVYRGGIIDLIAGTFWTFIFLQIIPFIYCLIYKKIIF